VLTTSPVNLAPIEVWKAYEQLEKNRVKGVPPQELLTNIVSLIRFSTGLSDVLEPFTELVNNRFENWLKQQNQIPSPLTREGQTITPSPSTGEGQIVTPSPLMGEGRGEGENHQTNRFSPDQLAWLNKIKDQIAQNAEMTVDDFNYIPFNQEGGLLKARELFGKDLEVLISELNGYLIA
jgi:type I restriction enzyme, R subunit